jgi:hypothetical protein
VNSVLTNSTNIISGNGGFVKQKKPPRGILHEESDLGRDKSEIDEKEGL